MASFLEGIDTTGIDFGAERDFFDDEARGNSRVRKVAEKHLNSPITVTLLERIIEYSHSVKLNFKKWPSAEGAINAFYREYPDKDFSSIRSHLKHWALIIPNTVRIAGASDYPALFRKFKKESALQEGLKRATATFKPQLEAYLSWISGAMNQEELQRARADLTNHKLSAETIFWDTQYNGWSSIVNSMRSSGNDRREREIGSTKIKYTRDVLMMNGSLLFTYNQIQLLQDVCLARRNVMLGIDLRITRGTSPQLRDHILSLLSWQEDCLLKYGNAGYELVKAPEGYIKTHLTKITDGDILYPSACTRMLVKLRGKEILMSLDGDSPLIRRLEKLISPITNIPDLAELFGLIKLSGHPTVWADKSAKSARVHGTSADTSSPLEVVRLLRTVKHMILSGYIDKKNDWPPFIAPPVHGTKLHILWSRRVTSLDMSMYDLSELDEVRLSKLVSFDYSDDYLKFLDDKAINPGARLGGTFWFSGDEKPRRRLMEEIFYRDTFKIRDVCKLFQENKVPADWKYIELTQKERELKCEARCFCKLPFDVRCFFTLTEYNLGEGVMKQFFPQQTMTDSESSTREKLFRSAHLTSKDDGPIIDEIDLTRWNLQWRPLVVEGVGRIMNDVYGEPGMFDKAHRFFRESTVIITDKHSLPDGARPDLPVSEWPESDLLWRNHLGGFEGIQQKLWTIATLAMIYSALDRVYRRTSVRVGFTLTGQGDNQVLTLFFPKGANKADLLDQILYNIEYVCKGVNQIVKPDECIDSSTVLTYSKTLFVRGVHYPYVLKFISRAFREEDLDVPSITKEISSLMSTSMANSAHMRHGILSVLFGLVLCHNSVYEMRDDPCISPAMRNRMRGLIKDVEFAKFFFSVPGSLGGLPIQTWGRTLIRGETDDLSWDVAAAVRTCEYYPLLAADLWLLSNGEFSKRVNVKMLFEDPHSIPVDRPTDETRLIEEAVIAGMNGACRNIDIRSLFSLHVQEEYDVLSKVMTEVRPLYPSIMADILEATPRGLQKRIIGKFVKTRTVVGMFPEASSFVTEIDIASRRFITYMYERYLKCKKIGARRQKWSAYSLTEQLRGLWFRSDKLPRGEVGNIVGMSVYTPLEWKLSRDVLTEPNISVISESNWCSLNTSVGPFPPNYGTKTRQKRDERGFRIVVSDNTTRDLKKLALLSSQLQTSGHLHDVISNIVSSRSPWTLDEISSVFPAVFGGTAAHRHDNLNTKPMGLNTSLSVPSHLIYSTDKSGQLSLGTLDYPVVFQEYFLSLACLASSFAEWVNPAPVALSFRLSDTMEPIDDIPPVLPSPALIQPTRLNSILAYVDTLYVVDVGNKIPDHILPRIDPRSQGVSAESVIFSYFMHMMTRESNTKKVQNSREGIHVPRSEMDISEAIGVGPHALISGAAAFVACEVAYRLMVGREEQFSYDLVDTLLFRVANLVSHTFVRTLLHDRLMKEKYVISLAAVLQPGATGVYDLNLHVVGSVVKKARYILRSDTAICSFRPLGFMDDEMHILNLLRRVAAIISLRCSLKKSADRMYTSAHRGWVLGNFRRAATPLSVRQVGISTEVMMASLIELLSVEDRRIQEVKDEFIPYLKSFSISTVSAELCFRHFRGRDRRPITSSPQPITLYTAGGQVKFMKSDQIHGYLEPPQPIRMSTVQKNLRIFSESSMRPYGRYSSVLSLWLPLLQRLDIEGMSCVCVGIGRGGSAAAAILQGMTVLGIERNEDIPKISHRYTDYKPAEVIQVSGADHFSFLPEVFSQNLDWTKRETQELALGKAELVIIDIQTEDSLTSLIPTEFDEDTVFMIRVLYTPERLRYELSTLTITSKVYHVGAFFKSNQITQFVITFDHPGRMIWAEGNFRNTMVNSPTRLSFSRVPPTEYDILEDLLIDSGFDLPDHSLLSLRTLAVELKRSTLATPKEDPARYRRRYLTQAVLEELVMLKMSTAEEYMVHLESWLDHEIAPFLARHIGRYVARHAEPEEYIKICERRIDKLGDRNEVPVRTTENENRRSCLVG